MTRRLARLLQSGSGALQHLCSGHHACPFTQVCAQSTAGPMLPCACRCATACARTPPRPEAQADSGPWPPGTPAVQEMTRPRNLHLPGTRAIQSQPDTTTLQRQARGSGARQYECTPGRRTSQAAVFPSVPGQKEWPTRCASHTHAWARIRQAGLPGGGAVYCPKPNTVTYQVRKGYRRGGAHQAGRAPSR